MPQKPDDLRNKQRKELLDRIIRDPAGHGIHSCPLCHGRVVFVGVFSPNQEFGERIGQPKGKTRLTVYGLCEPCMRLPEEERNQRIEADILRLRGVN